MHQADDELIVAAAIQGVLEQGLICCVNQLHHKARKTLLPSDTVRHL